VTSSEAFLASDQFSFPIGESTYREVVAAEAFAKLTFCSLFPPMFGLEIGLINWGPTMFFCHPFIGRFKRTWAGSRRSFLGVLDVLSRVVLDGRPVPFLSPSPYRYCFVTAFGTLILMSVFLVNTLITPGPTPQSLWGPSSGPLPFCLISPLGLT